jgi:hypothetical protein
MGYRITSLIITVAILSQPVCAQKSSLSLGWDLTYSSVLERNNVGRGEWIWKWLGPDYQSPVGKLISEWRGEPIVSSVLIEFPAFHAGEHTTAWFVRTKDHAYYWEFLEGKPPDPAKEALKPQLYDKLFATASAWQQGKPLRVEDTPTGGIPGYIGFLSLYRQGESRQMLLNLEDFFICETKDCESRKPGRLALALEPVMKESNE